MVESGVELRQHATVLDSNARPSFRRNAPRAAIPTELRAERKPLAIARCAKHFERSVQREAVISCACGELGNCRNAAGRRLQIDVQVQVCGSCAKCAAEYERDGHCNAQCHCAELPNHVFGGNLMTISTVLSPRLT